LTHAYHESVKSGMKEPVEDTVVHIGSALAASVATTMAGFLAMLLGVTPNSITQGKVLSLGIFYAFIITIVALPPLMILQRKFIYSKLDETIFRIRGRKDSIGRNPIDRFLAGLAKFQVKRPGLVLGIVGIITILIIPGFTLVYMDVEGENWIPDGDDVLISLEKVGYNFGGTESMNLIFRLKQEDMGDYDPNGIKDLRDPRVLRQMASLDRLVGDLKWVDSIDSPSTLIARYNNDRIPQDSAEINRIIEEHPDVRATFNSDFSIALFTPRADDIEYPEYFELMQELDGVSFPSEVEIIPQGSVPEDIELEQMMGSDTIRTALIGFVFVITLAALFFVSMVAGFLAFIPIVFAILWTVGIMGYINLPFTILTTGMLAILMGMGIDFSIHIMHSTKRFIKKYGTLEKAIPEAMMSTGQAIAVATITTMVGFSALSFATLVNTRRLGWTLAVGIFCTFFACMLIVPSVLALQHKWKQRRLK